LTGHPGAEQVALTHIKAQPSTGDRMVAPDTIRGLPIARSFEKVEA
jgi:hypothetical protein